MKWLIIICLLFSLISCTSRTEFGECVGIAESRKPNIEYDVAWNNVIVGMFFFETIIVPIIVLSKGTYCPISKKNKNNEEKM